jgi:hypothetical protein
MPLFGHRRPDAQRIGWMPGLADAAAAQGWQPVDKAPVPHLHDQIHDLTCCMYGFRPHQYPGAIGETTYLDAYRGTLDGRSVTVANAFTYIEPGLFQAGKLNPWVSVCAVELPTLVMPMNIQPRRFPAESRMYQVETGDAAFDGEFRVTGTSDVTTILTPEVRQRIMSRDDWALTFCEYMFATVCIGKYETAADVNAQVQETLTLIGLVPETAIPHEVDHSVDDIAARIRRIDTIEDAMAFLQGLTPAERQQLAWSNTPLAGFADVTTPAEAMARLNSMPIPERMRLLAMFERVDDR